jgi:UDP-glucose 4-epimerase
MRNGGDFLKKVLILGASGFIGKAVVDRLHDIYEITALDIANPPEKVMLDNVKYLEGNFVKRENFDDLLENIDIVIHLICTSIPKDDTAQIPEEIEQNVIPTINLLESMVRYGVKNIIFTSSAGTVYGETGNKVNKVTSSLNPRCSYGVQKCVIETYLKFYALRYGLNVKIMRITNPYGWGQDSKKLQGLIPIFINKIINNEEITVFGDGSHIRDYLFISDLAEAFEKVIEYSGTEAVFNIGCGEFYSINDIIKFIEKKIGHQFKNINYTENRFCDVNRSLVEVKKSQELLNWNPKISIHDGIELTIKRLKTANH